MMKNSGNEKIRDVSDKFKEDLKNLEDGNKDLEKSRNYLTN
jgi:hypothetical protein